MTEEKNSTSATRQHANGRHPAAGHQGAEHQPSQAEQQRRPAVNSGNPRITVAFPLSRIDIHEPSEALRDLAVMVAELAEQIATLARETAPAQGEASDRLAAQATLLARRLGAGS